MEPLVVLAGRVSSLDAVIVVLVWGIVRIVCMKGNLRVPMVKMALIIMAGLAAGVFATRLLVFLADNGYFQN